MSPPIVQWYCSLLGLLLLCQCVVFSPKELFGGPSPYFGTTLETTFSPLSFGKSFMKIRSVVPENGCLVFLWRSEKRKKTEKNICKTCLVGGCVNKQMSNSDEQMNIWYTLSTWPSCSQRKWSQLAYLLRRSVHVVGSFLFFFLRSGRAYTKWIPCTISRSDTFWRNDGPHNRTCVNVRQQVLILWTYWWACLLILLFFTLFVLAWASSLFNKELVDYLLVDHLIVIIGKIFHVCFEYVLYILAVLM